MTNREYMINLLLDGLEEKDLERYCFDDGGSSEEAMIHYNIKCPYSGYDERALCNDNERPSRELCVRCKWQWLDQEVDE